MDVAWHPPELNPEYPLGAYTDADGKLAVWVNASPGHKQHAGGWFEPYDGKPGDYRPKRDAEPDEDGYCTDPDGEYAAQARANRADRQRVSGELDALEAAARKSLKGEALKARLAEIEKGAAMIEHNGERYLQVGGLLVPEHAAHFPDEGVDWIARKLFGAEQEGLPRIAGGAESFPFEGLDVVLNTVLRKTGTQFPDPGFLGLFTSQTATTVPAQTAVLATPTGVTEATGGGYARISFAGSNWPAGATADTTGRRSTVASPGISFAETSGAYSVTNVNGFFVATAVTAGVALFYSNFDSGVAIVVNQAGYVVRIPPFAQFTD